MGCSVSGASDNVKVTSKGTGEYYTCKTYAVMADVQHYYMRTPFVHLYSGLYAGYGHFATNKSTGEQYSTVAFHATAIGVRIGKGLGVFGEAGFGYRGLLNVGVSARF